MSYLEKENREITEIRNNIQKEAISICSLLMSLFEERHYPLPM